MPEPSPLLMRFADIVGDRHVVVDADVLASYTTDWTGRFRGATAAVLRPGSTEEVGGIVSLCREFGAQLTIQGGNTGLVGGGVPLHSEFVLSLGRLNSLGEVDDHAGQVTAGAGVSIAAVQRAAAAAGWSYGVDLGSREVATVGGSVATNAGGSRVLRYGDTRAQVLGVEAVLGNGAVISHLGGLVKDNTGYALGSLLCGSEGTLGVVTAARLALVTQNPERVVALLAFDALGPAVDAAGLLRRAVNSLEAAELFLAEGLDLVCSVTGVPRPFRAGHRAFLLVEAADAVDPSAVLSEAIASVPRVIEVAVALDSIRRAELWHLREAHTEVVNGLGPPHKLDVTIAQRQLAEFMERVPSVVHSVAPAARVWLWGHAADGNVHVNVTGVAPDDERVDDAVLNLVAAYRGSISAEHGIGTAKRRWLALCRSDAEIEAFRALKQALDPDGVLNPNVLLPPL